ncbi:hypothetical protein [Streptomyces sp. NPDC005438]|uniref:hypothetical protein n=1 Tax=Streptomyces sp. NPDC005438 TaxID=3156880 RepID=UPI0033A4CA42
MLHTGLNHERGGDRSPRRPEPRNQHSASVAPKAPPGEAGDLVTVPARLGLEAVDVLRLEQRVGPVLHDRAGDTLGFLVPTGTAEEWELPSSACIAVATRPGHCPSTPPVVGTAWLIPPDEELPEATDPGLLRWALDRAARTIDAMDRCR